MKHQDSVVIAIGIFLMGMAIAPKVFPGTVFLLILGSILIGIGLWNGYD